MENYFFICRLVDCSLALLQDVCTNKELLVISQPDSISINMMKDVKNDLKC